MKPKMIGDWKEEVRQLLMANTTDGWEAALAVKDRHFPPRIFKFFRPTEFAFKNLDEGTVFLASPEDFNDPFDSGLRMTVLPMLQHFLRTQDIEGSEKLAKLGVSQNDLASMLNGTVDEEVVERMTSGESGGSKDELRELIKVLPVVLERMNQDLMVGRTSQFFRRALKVTCFTESADSVLLWAHYAQDHRGFCVEYDIRSVDPGLPQRRLLFPVFYNAERFDAGPSFLKAMTGTERYFPNHTFLAALHKGPDWAYEQEWRLVNPDGREQGFTIPMVTPTAVYAGVRMSDEHRKLVATICARKGLVLSTPILSPDGYDIHVGASSPTDALNRSRPK